MNVYGTRRGALLLGLAGVLALGGAAGMAYSQDAGIPGWIKGLFQSWTDEQVSDADLIGAIEFLVGAGVIQTDQSSRINELEQTIEDLQQENAALKAENANLRDGGGVQQQQQQQDDDDDTLVENVHIRAFSETESPVQGSPDAGVTIVEFGDYQCPNCKKWFTNTKPDISENYIQTGKANLVFVDIAFIGDDSRSAAQASYCAEDQGMYWQYHDKLYTSQAADYDGGWASVENLKGFASELGLDTELFGECLDSGKYQERVLSNTADAKAHGVSTTPSFLIISSDGQEEENVAGAQPYSVFESLLDAAG